MTAPAPAPDPRTLARELGMTDDEYEKVVLTLGREPSTAELGTYSVMWSEHCSYKSSKIYLKTLPTEGPNILVGPGENAGVVDVGDGLAVTFKIESHNHPSYVEPFQGAATGVGGIIRDILTMGARPIALMDPLRFGDPALAKTRQVVDGVVRGISHYGNSIGVPTVGGEVAFDPCYNGNPLVNVFCVGVLPSDNIQLAKAESVGDIAVLIGQRTGRDGIGGASILASEEFDEDGIDDAKRPNVQVGDPFAGKQLIESCLELYAADLLSGIQDMGAAGIACSTSEMASAAGLGMSVDLDKVELREASMEAWEILCSESQERMLAMVSPDKLDEVLAICERWQIDASPIGEVTGGDRLVFHRHGELVHDAPAGSLAHDGPTYERPVAEWVHPLRDVDVDGDAAAQFADGRDLIADVMAVLTSPNIAPPAWVTQQYDSIVGHGTVQGIGADAAVIRLDPGVTRGIAIATDGNGRWCALDPTEGARRVVAESARNVACTGARPVAATNCLNFGSPESPAIMGQFRDTITGMGEACLALGTPITGGNVSFYNQTGEVAVHPTPVMGVLGVHPNVAIATPSGFTSARHAVLLIGAKTAPGLSGSEWDWVTGERIAGSLDPIDLEREARLHTFLAIAGTDGVIASAHDVSTGGLATSLVEACGTDFGVTLDLRTPLPEHQMWFSESPGRVVVSAADPRAVDALAREHDLDVEVLGLTTNARRLVGGSLDLDLDAVATAQARVFPDLLGP
ncbi:phosphoribosylformylglycinamidine synthase subunit PurL [Euzebya tangerina]|uniref:phosphoribosylformylglycinamidine synthase subunit PurL n=1 Tax=Euzebya tangerina TaxID=591198 RepID=UPI000E322E17|nr:phosphoribosylformylglycinamidine synthase subunit PurL [Euzebya tangerina]